MREEPSISATEIAAALKQFYGLSTPSIAFLPIGDDATAWFFRVDTADHGTYALKLKRGSFANATLTIPVYLSNHNFPAAVAPIVTERRELAAPCGDFTLILYPFITSETGMALGLSALQWRNFGTLLRRLHATSLPVDLARQLPRESFTLHWHETMQLLEQRVDTLQSAAPIERALAALWRDRRNEIGAIIERTAALGRQLQAAPPPFVLCHADIHTANLLVDSVGALHIVDWDGVMLAPKERDLIFVTERATIQHPHERSFFAGYGNGAIDPRAFAYYRYEWVVQEFADYGSRILLRDDLGEETRATALDEFRQLFAPGDVVDVAYGTEIDL